MERALCQLIVRSKSSQGMRGPYSSRCVQRQLFLPVLLALPSYTSAVAEDVEFQDDKVMHHPAAGRRRCHRIGEDVLPLGQDQGRGYSQGPAFVPLGDQGEEHFRQCCSTSCCPAKTPPSDDVSPASRGRCPPLLSAGYSLFQPLRRVVPPQPLPVRYGKAAVGRDVRAVILLHDSHLRQRLP